MPDSSELSKTRKRKFGAAPIKDFFIGVRLSPVEWDYINSISIYMATHDGGSVNHSETIRIIIREHLSRILAKEGVSQKEVSNWIKKIRAEYESRV